MKHKFEKPEKLVKIALYCGLALLVIGLILRYTVFRSKDATVASQTPTAEAASGDGASTQYTCYRILISTERSVSIPVDRNNGWYISYSAMEPVYWEAWHNIDQRVIMFGPEGSTNIHITAKDDTLTNMQFNLSRECGRMVPLVYMLHKGKKPPDDWYGIAVRKTQ